MPDDTPTTSGSDRLLEAQVRERNVDAGRVLRQLTQDDRTAAYARQDAMRQSDANHPALPAIQIVGHNEHVVDQPRQSVPPRPANPPRHETEPPTNNHPPAHRRQSPTNHGADNRPSDTTHAPSPERQRTNHPTADERSRASSHGPAQERTNTTSHAPAPERSRTTNPPGSGAPYREDCVARWRWTPPIDMDVDDPRPSPPRNAEVSCRPAPPPEEQSFTTFQVVNPRLARGGHAEPTHDRREQRPHRGVVNADSGTVVAYENTSHTR